MSTIYILPFISHLRILSVFHTKMKLGQEQKVFSGAFS